MSDILERTREAYVAAFRLHTTAAGGETIERERLITLFSGSPAASFNPTIALAHGFGADLEAVENDYRARGIPFGFLVDERFFDEATEAAARLGFDRVEPRPSMALSPVPSLDAPEVDIRVVSDAAALEQHVLVQASGFGTNADHIRRFMPPSVLDHEEIYYLASIDGLPVATSTLVLTPPAAGIYAVSTLPDYRRRGLGRAVTVAAVRDAARLGCDLVYLQASPLGYPVYEALGFRTVEEQRIFARTPRDPAARP